MTGKRLSGVERVLASQARDRAKRLAASARGIKWIQVKRHAENNASEAEIIEGLGISEEQLKVPEDAARLRDMVRRGNALFLLGLKGLNRRAAEKKGDVGVNTLAQLSRNVLGYDKQTETQEQPPDLQSAHARLRLTIERIAAARSEEAGRVVSPAEILLQDVLPAPEGAVKH